jgi:predicted metalloprotease with PDZ domain
MKIKILVGLWLLFECFSVQGQQYRYTVYLKDIKNDRVRVELLCPQVNTDKALFHFPMTVPGTYAVLDYGKYIEGLKAYDAAGKSLKVTRETNNTFAIYDAKGLSKLEYLVNDSWDSSEKTNKIFEPAGTGFQKGKYFAINTGALFGFFDSQLSLPFVVTFKKPDALKGYSSLVKQSDEKELESFVATDYHQLIDNPILFTGQPSETLQVGNCKVVIASYYERDSASAYTRKNIEKSMEAINKFVGDFPVDRYTFLLFIEDQHEVGEALIKGDLGFFAMLKLAMKMRGKAYGALEHGTSSMYFLPDFHNHSYTAMVKDVAIHEFMHIFTPLILHSEHIGNFDYTNPKMSEHLWLYEGITEYFSVLIQMQGGLDSVDNIVKNDIKQKIVQSYAYPDSIPFTVMSRNVFEKPYKDLYMHVYDRGAIMGMLLDFEIMHLTQGRLTLRDVVLQLGKKYGANKSFKEETFISEFVAMVHPDLQQFFDKHVTGKVPLDIEGGFKKVGIEYKKELEGIVPIDLLSAEDNGVDVNRNIVINNYLTIKKVGKQDVAGFKPGDKVNPNQLMEAYKDKDGKYLPEGTMAYIEVIRNGKPVKLSFPVRFKQGKIKDHLVILENKTPDQERLFSVWTKGK